MGFTAPYFYDGAFRIVFHIGMSLDVRIAMGKFPFEFFLRYCRHQNRLLKFGILRRGTMVRCGREIPSRHLPELMSHVRWKYVVEAWSTVVGNWEVVLE